jgi:hypothetical protein
MCETDLSQMSEAQLHTRIELGEMLIQSLNEEDDSRAQDAIQKYRNEVDLLKKELSSRRDNKNITIGLGALKMRSQIGG